MRLGVLLSLIDGNNPRAIAEQASALEEQGYSSIWSAQAMGRGFMMSDPLMTLSAIAAVTSKVEIGTAILQLPLYHPTDIALKAFALSQLSGNRFILGVGAGSTASDYKIHDSEFSSRFSRFDDCLSELRETFATGMANNIDLKPWSSVQQGPPVFFGTWGKNVARAATEFDGWIASGMHRSVDECVAAIKDYRANNGKRAIVSTIQLPAGQDLGELRERFARYDESGFDDAVVMFQPGGPTPEQVRKLV